MGQERLSVLAKKTRKRVNGKTFTGWMQKRIRHFSAVVEALAESPASPTVAYQG